MANTLISPTAVANEALVALENNLVFANLVHRDFENEFANKGQTVRVRKPASFNALNHDGTTGSISNITEDYVDVTIDQLLFVDVALTAKEKSLSLADMSTQVIQPAARALAQKIDKLLSDLYKDIPYNSAVSSTPAVSDVANALKVLNENKAPMDNRNAVLSPKSHANFSSLDTFLRADARGDTMAIREASMGRVMGCNFYMDQNVTQDTTKGDLDALAQITINPGGTVGVVASAGNVKSIADGEIFTISGVSGSFVCTEAKTSTSGGVIAALPIYPANGTATVQAVMAIASGGDQSMVFHKDAFALVTRPISPPLGANSASVNFDGLSITAVYTYDNDKKQDVLSFQVLCGLKTLTQELAVRLIDRGA